MTAVQAVQRHPATRSIGIVFDLFLMPLCRAVLCCGCRALQRMSVGHQEQPGDGEEEVVVVYQQQQQEDVSGNGGSGSGHGPQQAMWVDAIGEDAGCSSPAFQTELAEPALPLPPRSSPQSLALRLARHSAPLALHMHRLSPSASMPQSPSRRGAAGGAAGEAASSAGDGGGSMLTPFGAGNLQRHSTGASFPGGQPSHSPSWDWGARQASGFLDPAAAASPVVVDADAEDSQRSITRLMGACCAPCCRCRCQRCCRRGLLHLPGSRLQCLAGQAGTLCVRRCPVPCRILAPHWQCRQHAPRLPLLLPPRRCHVPTAAAASARTSLLPAFPRGKAQRERRPQQKQRCQH